MKSFQVRNLDDFMVIRNANSSQVLAWFSTICTLDGVWGREQNPTVRAKCKFSLVFGPPLSTLTNPLNIAATNLCTCRSS